MADRKDDGPDDADVENLDLVIKRAHVFDGEKMLSGLKEVGVRGGEIVAVSDDPLEGELSIDAGEGFVLPGLIDTHLHLINFAVVTSPETWDTYETGELRASLDSFLQFGITTIKSVGDPTTEILDVRARLASGALRGPRLLATGSGITAVDGHPATTIFGSNPWFRARSTGEVDTRQQMRDLVHHLADRNVDAIKLLSQGGCWCPGSPQYIWRNPAFDREVPIVRLRPDLMRAGVEVAHERGLRVTVHTVDQQPAIEALEAGADALEHGVALETITDKKVIDLLLKKDATYTPTLWIHENPEAAANLKTVADAGVKVVLGTDSFSGRGRFGENSVEEAEKMVAAGVTTLQTLRAATSMAAVQLVRPDIGRIKPGKRADLIVLASDPLAEISHLRTLMVTIQGGRVVVDKR